MRQSTFQKFKHTDTSGTEAEVEQRKCGHPVASNDGKPCGNSATHDDGKCGHHSNVGGETQGRPSKFSDERARQVIEMARNSKSKSACARAIGVSRSSVHRWEQHNCEFTTKNGAVVGFGDALDEAYSYDGCIAGKFTDSIKEDVIEYAEEGLTKQECADKAGISTRALYDWLDEHDEFAEAFANAYCWERELSESRDYRGPNWTTQRQKALERDGYRCMACGVSAKEHRRQYEYGLHVHHIIERRHFEDTDPEQNALENLVTLCHGCHGVYESTQLSPVQRVCND